MTRPPIPGRCCTRRSSQPIRHSPTRSSRPTMGCCCGHSGDAQKKRDRTPTPATRGSTSSGSAFGTWGNVTGAWPQRHTVDSPIFTGSKILWRPARCGAEPARSQFPGPLRARLHRRPQTLHISPIPHGPLDDLGPQIIWTGAAEIAFNAGGEITGPHISVLPGDIAIWNPRTRRWARGPRAPRQLITTRQPCGAADSSIALARDGTCSPTGAERPPAGKRGNSSAHRVAYPDFVLFVLRPRVVPTTLLPTATHEP